MADQKTDKAGAQSTALSSGGGLLDLFGGIASARASQIRAGDRMRSLLTEGIRASEQHIHRAAMIAEAGAAAEAAQKTAFANAGVEVSSGTPAAQVERTAVASEIASLSEVFAGNQALIDSQRAAKRIERAAKETARFQNLQVGTELIIVIAGAIAAGG